jgi:CHASE3 domain sensor protein
VVHIVQEEQPDQQATKDLEAAKESAQKALKDAREVQEKLSFTENARLAEEKAKIENAKRAWQKWLWMGVGAALLALVMRSWLRRRG